MSGWMDGKMSGWMDGRSEGGLRRTLASEEVLQLLFQGLDPQRLVSYGAILEVAAVGKCRGWGGGLGGRLRGVCVGGHIFVDECRIGGGRRR